MFKTPGTTSSRATPLTSAGADPNAPEARPPSQRAGGLGQNVGQQVPLQNRQAAPSLQHQSGSILSDDAMVAAMVMGAREEPMTVSSALVLVSPLQAIDVANKALEVLKQGYGAAASPPERKDLALGIQTIGSGLALSAVSWIGNASAEEAPDTFTYAERALKVCISAYKMFDDPVNKENQERLAQNLATLKTTLMDACTKWLEGAHDPPTSRRVADVMVHVMGMDLYEPFL